MTKESYTEDADVSHLETRIDELEETIRKMLPSRREALGMGVAGLAGASLMSGTASAGSAQVGTIGDSSNLVDLVAEDVTISDTLNSASLSGAAGGEALLSDGNGNLTFGSAGGGLGEHFKVRSNADTTGTVNVFENNSTVIFDSKNSFDTTTGEYTVQESGLFLIEASVLYDEETQRFLVLKILVNGSVPQGNRYQFLFQNTNVLNANTHHSITHVQFLNANDTLALESQYDTSSGDTQRTTHMTGIQLV